MVKTFQALSVVAPAGIKIQSGLKRIEVRQWRPDALPLRDLLIVENKIRLSSSGVSEDPNGRAVALVDVMTVTEWKEEELAAATARYWEPGWLAWHLANVRPLKNKETVPAKLRLYEIELLAELA